MTTATLRTLNRKPYLPACWLRALADLPPIYAQDGKGDAATAYVKFFDPCGSWTWFAIEGEAYTADGRWVPIREALDAKLPVWDVKCFGLVQGVHEELGYFTLRELASICGPFGVGIERDVHFEPTALSNVRN